MNSSSISFISNSKFIIKNWIYLLILFINFLVTFIISLLASLKTNQPIQYLLNDIKLYWILFIVANTFLISLGMVYLIYYFFVKQYNNGIQSIEIKNGIKKINIFLIRYLLVLTFSLLIYIINLITSSILLSIYELPTEIYNNQFLYTYVGELIIIFIIPPLTIFSMLLIKNMFSMIIPIVFITFISLSPIINSFYFNNVTIINERDKVSANIKLNIGDNFNKFINENEEYKFLIEDFILLEDKGVLEEGSLDWGPNGKAFNFGLWLDSQFLDLVEKINDANPHEYKIIKFADELNKFLKNWQNNNFHKNNIASSENWMFNSRNGNVQNYDPLVNNLSLFLEDLINSNFENGAYNKLFAYLKDLNDRIIIYNELNNIGTKPNGFIMGGKILNYGYSGTMNVSYWEIFELNKYYNHTLLPNLFWLLGQNLRYATTYDIQQIKVFKEPQNEDNLFIINPLIQFNQIFIKQTYGLNALSDIWNIHSERYYSFSNYYYDIDLPDQVLKIDLNSPTKWNFRFKPSTVDKIGQPISEIKATDFKLKQKVIVELLISMYILLSSLFMYINTIIYKKMYFI